MNDVITLSDVYIEDTDTYQDVEVEIDNIKEEVLENVSNEDLQKEFQRRNLRLIESLSKDKVIEEFFLNSSDFNIHNLLCDIVGCGYHDSDKEEKILNYIKKVLKARK